MKTIIVLRQFHMRSITCSTSIQSLIVSNRTIHPQPYFARRCLNIINLLHSKFYTQTLAAATWKLHKLSCQLNGRLSDKKENLESISLKSKGPIIKLNMSSKFPPKDGLPLPIHPESCSLAYCLTSSGYIPSNVCLC